MSSELLLINESLLVIAFVLTGIGLLIYLLNKKDSNRNARSSIRSNTYFNNPTPIKEKYILALLIKSDRYRYLIDSLNSNQYLQPKDSHKLYGATQALWIGTKSKFERSQIKQELNEKNRVNTTSEYDVHFVTIELDKYDSRFDRDVNQMDRRDAFIESSFIIRNWDV